MGHDESLLHVEDGRDRTTIRCRDGGRARIDEQRGPDRDCGRAAEVDDRGAKHAQDEYSALRMAQKLEGARLAAPLVLDEPWALAWLDDGLGAERDAVMARLAAIA